MRQPPPPLRTYSHLAGRGAVPTDYEIVSSGLLYYPQRGFEIDVPVAAWYERHQRQSPLQLPYEDAEAFADPRATTYASYTHLQAASEQHLDAVARSMQLTGHDGQLSAAWLAELEAVLPPLRYACHGLQMMAAYFGHMAPGGRITLVALFQAADQMRRIHRFAQRMGRLGDLSPGFGGGARAAWEGDPAWQPLRKVIEEALCAYDWGESFVATCLALGPALDEGVLEPLAARARTAGDFSLGEILAAFAEDAHWHRAWAGAFVRACLASQPDNRVALRTWVARWQPAAVAAVAALAARGGETPEAVGARVDAGVTAWLAGLGLGTP